MLQRTVFSSEQALDAVAVAKADKGVLKQLGAILDARVVKRTELAIGPDWLRRETFVIRLNGTRNRGTATVERVLPTQSSDGTPFHVTQVELE